MRASGKRVPYLLVGVVSIAAMVSSLVLPFEASAAGTVQITNRSLKLEDGTVPGSAPGDGNPAHTVNHLFTFTLPDNPGNETVSSISFQYCTTADIDVAGGTCTTPNGLTTSAATLGTAGGSATAAFDGINVGTNGAPFVTSTGGFNMTGGQAVTIELNGVQNPNNTNCGGVTPASNNCTFYVRITAYSGNDGATGPLEAGTVAATTASAIVLTGTMPESLIFCTGATIAKNGSGIPDCSTATSGNITFPMLFSPSATAYTTSQMAASTNAQHGYSITLEGTTLQSGSNSIKAIGGTAAASSIGSPQFGLNLVKDDGTVSGPDMTTIQTNYGASYANSANITPASDGSSYMGEPALNFGANGSFAFNDTAANIVANSDWSSTGPSGTSAPTDSQIYTASYIVNVDGAQPAGTYKTTLTYICTPTF